MQRLARIAEDDEVEEEPPTDTRTSPLRAAWCAISVSVTAVTSVAVTAVISVIAAVIVAVIVMILVVWGCLRFPPHRDMYPFWWHASALFLTTLGPQSMHSCTTFDRNGAEGFRIWWFHGNGAYTAQSE